MKLPIFLCLLFVAINLYSIQNSTLPIRETENSTETYNTKNKIEKNKQKTPYIQKDEIIKKDQILYHRTSAPCLFFITTACMLVLFLFINNKI